MQKFAKLTNDKETLPCMQRLQNAIEEQTHTPSTITPLSGTLLFQYPSKWGHLSIQDTQLRPK